MQYKISELTMLPENKVNISGEVFVSQPDAIKEELAGKLFVLLEIEDGDARCPKLINFLVSELNRHYYQSEKMILRERLSTIKVDHIFEAALAKTNKALINFAQTEKILLKPELINSIVGVAYADELHFSILGKGRAFMIFRNKQDGDGNYKIIEVGRDEEGREPGSAKLFTNVISGSIPPGGYFLFTNEALPEYLSAQQLKGIITTLPPGGAAEQIKNLLKQINSYIPFFGIIVKNTVGAKAETEVVARPTGAEGSIYGLKSTEERTEKLLAPSGIIDLSGRLNLLKNKLGLGRLSRPSFSSDKLLLRGALFFKKKPNLKLLKNAASAVRQAFFIFLQAIVYVAKLPFSLDRARLTVTLDGLKTQGSAYAKLPFEWFKRLNKKQKALIIIAAVSLFLFLQNSLVLNFKNRSVEEEKTSLELQTAIEQKADQVEAALIYRNESGARELLAEIKSLLDRLPQKTAEQKSVFERLDKRYRDYLEKIKHLIKIDRLNELVDLSQTAPGAAAVNLSWTGEKFLAASADGTVYLFDPASKAANAVNTEPAGGGLASPSVAGGAAYYLSGDHLWQIDAKSGKAVRLAIESPGADLGAVAGAAVYNSRLYLLHRDTGQIYRLERQGAGYARGAAWLKTPADFRSASALFIDGDIYVLETGGQAEKFLKGKAEDLKLDTVEPPLKTSNKLAVTQKQKYLYVLEPESKRLVVFDKTGKFIVQYEVSTAEAVKDFCLDEKTKKIYLLAGNKIFEAAGQYF